MSTSSIFTWWPPKKNKKGQHPVVHGLCYTTAIGLYFCKIFPLITGWVIKSTPDYPPGQEQRVSN